MADNERTIVINDPAALLGVKGRAELKSTTKKSGAIKYSVEVRSEPVVHDFDPKRLGKPVADALADALRRRVMSIAASVKPSTLVLRQKAEKALAGGKKWATKRYAGGRIGATPPNQSTRAFNDSGRLAKSIAATGNEEGWRINVAANRLDPTTTSGEIGVRRMWNRLVELVPALRSPAMLFDDGEVKAGVNQSINAIIHKLEATRDQLSQARIKAAISTYTQVVNTLASLAG